MVDHEDELGADPVGFLGQSQGSLRLGTGLLQFLVVFGQFGGSLLQIAASPTLTARRAVGRLDDRSGEEPLLPVRQLRRHRLPDATVVLQPVLPAEPASALTSYSTSSALLPSNGVMTRYRTSPGCHCSTPSSSIGCVMGWAIAAKAPPSRAPARNPSTSSAETVSGCAGDEGSVGLEDADRFNVEIVADRTSR